MRCANFLKASRASGLTVGFLPAGQAAGESGLGGNPGAGYRPAPGEGAGQEGSVWGGHRAGAEETGLPRQQVPGKERGRPQGTPESLESLGELGLDPRAPCRVRPLTWKGSPPRGTALPSDQRSLAFAPVRVPAPRIPLSAPPPSPTLARPWPETPGSGVWSVRPERSVGSEGAPQPVCRPVPVLGLQALPLRRCQSPGQRRAVARRTGPLEQRRSQARVGGTHSRAWLL